VPGDPERSVAGSLRETAATRTIFRPFRIQLGLAVSKHKEHLRDERTLHSQECHCHSVADLQGRCHHSDASLQAWCTVHVRRYVVEDERLCPESDTIPLLGNSGGRQLPGLAERGRHSLGYSGHSMGIGRWYRKYFGAACAQMSSKDRRH